MGTLKWLDGMSVGIKEMDDDHIAMFDTLSNIHDALGAADTAKAQALCEELYDMSKIHGAKEEAFLRLHEFPGIDKVLMVQMNTITGIEDLASIIAKGDAPKAIEKVDDMQERFIDYMLRGDINYKSFVFEHDLEFVDGEGI